MSIPKALDEVMVSKVIRSWSYSFPFTSAKVFPLKINWYMFLLLKGSIRKPSSS